MQLGFLVGALLYEAVPNAFHLLLKPCVIVLLQHFPVLAEHSCRYHHIYCIIGSSFDVAGVIALAAETVD